METLFQKAFCNYDKYHTINDYSEMTKTISTYSIARRKPISYDTVWLSPLYYQCSFYSSISRKEAFNPCSNIPLDYHNKSKMSEYLDTKINNYFRY